MMDDDEDKERQDSSDKNMIKMKIEMVDDDGDEE